MSFPDALDVVMSLAEPAYHARLANNENGTQASSGSQRLETALETVASFIQSHRDHLAKLTIPRLGTGWPEFVYGDNLQLNPAVPLDAIRICLAAASSKEMGNEDATRLRDRYGSDIQRRAEDMVQSLIGLHGAVVTTWTRTEPFRAGSLSPLRLPNPA